jgi:hypothetical protein
MEKVNSMFKEGKYTVYENILVGFGVDDHVIVMGDGEMGWYEFQIVVNGKNVYESDNEYGQVWIALMDGLNKYNSVWG